MYRSTEPDPAQRRAAAEYRFAMITRDYHRLPPVHDSWWQRRRKAHHHVG